jgi:hypothetical protein
LIGSEYSPQNLEAGSIAAAAANTTDDNDASDDACAIVDDAGPNGANAANDDIAMAAFDVDDAIIARRGTTEVDMVDVVVVYAHARE